MLSINVLGIDDAIKSIQAAIDNKQKEIVKEKVPLMVQKLADATPKKTGAASKAWTSVTSPDGKSAQIVNDKPYIQQLNAGSSKQAPAHFIEKTVLSVDDVAPNGNITTYR